MEEKKHRRRFCFSLHTLFVVVTLGCVVGGLCRYTWDDAIGITIVSIWVLGLASLLIAGGTKLAHALAKRL